MAKAPKKTYYSVDEVLEVVLDSDCECSSDSELGELSSDEEEMLNEGIDPEVDVQNSSGDESDTPTVVQNEPTRKQPPKRRKKTVDSGKKTQSKNWKTATEIDKEPDRRRFKPLREPGCQLPIDYSWKPVDIFKLFFSLDIMKQIVKNTEEFAATVRAKRKYMRWKTLTVKELYAILGIIIFMGLIDVPAIPDYWNSDGFYGQQFVRNSGINKTRFNNVLACLHLCNLEEDRENTKKKAEKQPYDPLFKLKPLLDDLTLLCKTYYVPGMHVSIDERMVAFKGRSGLKQYIKNKPTKWGFKIWVLADSKTGYTYTFQIYTGKRQTKTKNGLGYDVVTGLMHDLLYQGYHLYIDNFFSSPILFQDLFNQGCFSTGTVRDNRIGNSQKSGDRILAKNAPRGTSKWFRDGQLVYVKWKDTREVTVMSTFWQATGTDTVKRKQKKDGTYSVHNVNIPPPIVDYNQNMGGVDLSDQLIKYFNVLKKCKKWWKVLFYHFIDMSIVNSFILYNTSGGNFDQKSFRQKIALALVQDYAETDQEIASPQAGRPPRSTVRAKHCPIPVVEAEEIVDKCDRATSGRKNCKLCYVKNKKQQRTPWQCSACQVPLCLQLDRNCFQEWHSATSDKFRE